MKTAIIYYSKHHGNTKQVLEAIQKESSDEITLLDVLENDSWNLEDYDMIGFASGIYYSKFHKKVLEVAKNNIPEGKKVFFVYTYGAEKKGYTAAINDALKDKKATVLGEFGCFGFNTFGPFKLIGGIAKNHPDRADMEHAVSFYKGLHN